jgi:hypothetical protein
MELAVLLDFKVNRRSLEIFLFMEVVQALQGIGEDMNKSKGLSMQNIPNRSHFGMYIRRTSTIMGSIVSIQDI